MGIYLILLNIQENVQECFYAHAYFVIQNRNNRKKIKENSYLVKNSQCEFSSKFLWEL